MVFIRVLGLIVLVNANVLTRKQKTLVKYEQMCRNLTENPFFENEMVVGPTWRTYYAWNMIMGNDCLDMKFGNATKTKILRFREQMNAFLDTKPDWFNATLLLTMADNREILLFPDMGSSNPEDKPDIGRFLGVPNIHKGDYLGARIGKVKLFKLAMKIFQNGRFLLIGDCENGVISFLVRRDQKHTWGEITSAVTTLGLKFEDQGYPSCKFNRRKKLQQTP